MRRPGTISVGSPGDGTSLVELLAPLAEKQPTPASRRGVASRLDQLYVPTRSPTGLPGGVPAEVFTEDPATEAT